MSFLFGGRPGYRDKELEAGNRRFRQHIARDINDERTLAAGGEIAGHSRRTGWVLLVAVAAFFVLVALFRGGGGSGELPITRSCTAAALVLGSPRVQGGTPFELRSTGPQDATYILTVDGTPVQGQPDTQVPLEQTPDGPSYSLIDCVSPTFQVGSPTQAGPHEIGLLQVDATGTREVATVTLNVTG